MARGRKVNSNGERSKQLLLEKALALFSEKGYHDTKISDIVKAANVTQPTFYLYFESKDALYTNLNKRFQQGFDEIMGKQLEEGEEGLEGFVTELKQKIQMLFVYIIDNPKLTKIGLFESKQSLVVKSRLTQQFTHLIHRYDCAHILQSYCADINIVVDSFVGSLERLILTNLLEQKKQPCELASDLVHLYFLREVNTNICQIE